MSYDDTKLIQAFNRWLPERCEIRFGETYSAALESDFEEWCYQDDEHGLKTGPGRIAFGRMMTNLCETGKVDRVRRGGRMYYAGIVLKNEKYVQPRSNRVRGEDGELQDPPRYLGDVNETL